MFDEVAHKLAKFWADTCLTDSDTGIAQVQLDLARTVSEMTQ